MSHLPQDLYAEHTLAAMATLSPHGATVALEVLDDILDPNSRAVVIAGATTDITEFDERTSAVALAADVPRTLIEDWMRTCVTMWDVNGRVRDLVRAAARRRQRALELATELEQLIGLPIGFKAPA